LTEKHAKGGKNFRSRLATKIGLNTQQLENVRGEEKKTTGLGRPVVVSFTNRGKTMKLNPSKLSQTRQTGWGTRHEEHLF